MKTVVLKGVVIKIGDLIRFIDNTNLYSGLGYLGINLPKLGGVYKVRGFSINGGFLLSEINNSTIDWFDNINPDNSISTEPGFAIWRFEPSNPLIAEVKNVLSKNKVITITIDPEVIETLELEKELI